jgi:hypothetical protein
MKRIQKPIIIVGTGRSGTTLLHNIMSYHPRLSWLAAILEKMPNRTYINRFAMRALDIPVLQNMLRDISHFEPGECYQFWDYYVKGFGSIYSPPMRDLTAGDVTEISRNRIHKVFPTLLSEYRNRLLIKISGWPRVGYLREIFPDARLIHIIRDGRAVANSFLNVDWWWGWRGPGNWRHGELPDNYLAEWRKHRHSFIALAGIEWKILLDAFHSSVQHIDKSEYLEIRYEDLCADKSKILEEILDFCELENSPKFARALANFPVKNTNFKWKKDLSTAQAGILEDVLASHLDRYGYK